jgi:predicted AlkP superfamily phosphohydrolase/phosphomutase
MQRPDTVRRGVSLAAAVFPLVLASLALGSCGEEQGPDVPGMFVLGVDGMDPVITQRLMDEGKLPAISKLAKEGGFHVLGTVNPPQSPVAWSSFVTGLDPGGHGIFDFVHRDPARYVPISSATPPPGDPGSSVEIAGYYFPIGGDTVGNNRGGVPFWDTLKAAGVDTEVYRIPGNYPVPDSEAKVLSGMGTVDMRGGYGVYTWFTDKPVTGRGEIKGDVQLVTVQDSDLDGIPDSAHGTLKGPPDLFHLPAGQSPGPSDYLTAGVTFWLDPDADAVLIEAGDEQVLLKEGEWSGWVTLNFDALPHGAMDYDGMVRFYAKELRPNFVVYASPVNISPADPAQPVATPDGFAEDLSDILGLFYTQGMPEETNALKDGLFTDDDYIKQVALVQKDTRDMLDVALARFEPGDMTFMYVSDIDLQCHMLWRHGDPKHLEAPHHPAYDAAAAATHSHDIENFYRAVDRHVARIRAALPSDTTFVVMSDHGFQPYTREVHLNSWLRDHGWLTLKDGKQTGQIAAGDVDWSKTRAYNIGFNAIYLNLQGREAQGIVAPGDADAVMAELSNQLLAVTDPKDGKNIIKGMARSKDIYSEPRRAEAPDLIVGYDIGYGTSDQSTLGEIIPDWISDNTSRWSGNHLMDPRVVPGVILANRPLPDGDYDLLDVTSTVLAHFGLPNGPGMTGSPIFTN